ncbi:hypothetical protein LCGC14_1371630 [marine sediment metagenome]|uniref:Uncharacterized protein n=1 Tax=marine sediment metagenome TaxID=412755 RepID=A0A0F9KRA4_9ZZZZ
MFKRNKKTIKGEKMKTEVCPCCEGKGVVEVKEYTGNPYADHPNRTLPLDYYCRKHKQFVTVSHGVNYGCKKYMHKKKRLLAKAEAVEK